LGNLANLYSTEGREAKAETMLREALAIDSELFGAADARTAMVAVSLARTLVARRNYQEAETLLQHAIQVLEGQPHASAERLSIALDNLGALRFDQERFQEAVALYKPAIPAPP
jgi:tetratricopeptide (TPR) repeat protein